MIKKRLLADSRFDMTLPDERYRAVIQTAEFLQALSYSSEIKRVPLAVRQEARRLLRHYPSEWEMRRVAEGHGETMFQVEMEPLHRMVLQYQQDKEEK
jgi:hypothetical protein